MQKWLIAKPYHYKLYNLHSALDTTLPLQPPLYPSYNFIITTSALPFIQLYHYNLRSTLHTTLPLQPPLYPSYNFTITTSALPFIQLYHYNLRCALHTTLPLQPLLYLHTTLPSQSPPFIHCTYVWTKQITPLHLNHLSVYCCCFATVLCIFVKTQEIWTDNTACFCENKTKQTGLTKGHSMTFSSRDRAHDVHTQIFVFKNS